MHFGFDLVNGRIVGDDRQRGDIAMNGSYLLRAT